MSGTFFCIITCFYMLFGVLFYELRVVTSIDEIVTIAIAAHACYQMFTRRIPLNKPFIIWLIISIFYLVYSFVIESNVPVAIVNDFVMQSKPYLVFFGLMCIKPKLERNHYTVLQALCWLTLCLIILIYIYHPDDRKVATHGVMLTGEALSAVAILVGTLYYLCCDRDDWINRLFTLLIMSVGILSPTSKYWGTLVFAVIIIFFVNRQIKLNFRYLIVGALALGITFYAVQDEFIYYFIEDFEYNARPMLYIKMWDVLADYIPFGSGFATFANPASMIWYSKIYTKYDLDSIWGLDQGNEEHFASDAYYPIFAQFGYVGIVLFIWFLVYLFKKINGYYAISNDIKRYKTALIIVAYILIQATSNALANERCVLAMAILVLALYKYQPKRRITALNSFGLDFANFAPNIDKKDEDSANK